MTGFAVNNLASGNNAQETSRVIYAINAGGNSYTSKDGTIYQSDRYYKGGVAWNSKKTVAGTDDSTLYSTERYNPIYYEFKVDNGTYEVTLKFAEVYFTKENQRIFNVYIQGRQVLSDFDIVKEAKGPNKAVDRSWIITQANGKIRVAFTNAGASYPKVDAILIKKINNATVSSTSTPNNKPAGETPRIVGGSGGGGSGGSGSGESSSGASTTGGTNTCTPEDINVTCNNQTCGALTNNCGESVTCDATTSCNICVQDIQCNDSNESTTDACTGIPSRCVYTPSSMICSGNTTQPCAANNGTGMQVRTCDQGNWSTFGICTLTSCISPDFNLSANSCICTPDSINATCSGKACSASPILGKCGLQVTCNLATSCDECNVNAQCNDNNVSTTDTCGGMPQRCIHTPIPLCTGNTTQSCSIANGIGIQNRTCNLGNWSSWNTCTVSSCNAGYNISGNTCIALTCSGNTTQSCSITNGVGIQNRTCINGTWTGWNTCSIVNCNNGYFINGTICSLAACTGSANQSCNVSNGYGTQSRTCTNGVWGLWNTCTVTSCILGYQIIGNACSLIPCTAESINTTCNAKTCNTVVLNNCNLSITCNLSTSCYTCAGDAQCNDNNASTTDTCSGMPQRCVYTVISTPSLPPNPPAIP